jgi:polar amino acid transport system substrate-binding protein
MKTSLYSFIFALSVWCTAAVSQTCDKLIITGPPAGPPSSWTQDGKLIGASVDFIRSIAQAAGVKSVVAKPYPTWGEALKAAQTGEVDMIFSVGFSKERARYLNYIQPNYAGQFLYAIVLKGKEFPLTKYDDLKGRTGIAGKGESYGNSKFGVFVDSELSLERSNSITHSFQMLFEGKGDYILAYEYNANSEIFKQNLGDSVTVLETYPYFADTYIAFSLRSKCSDNLTAAISKQIEIAKKNNLYYLLANKYQNIFYESFESSKR